MEREIFSIFEMYKNSRTAVKVEGVKPEWFDVNVYIRDQYKVLLCLQ